ncbi:non-ribosomal peptide synthetase [Streptomyces sp. NRRL WC-3742]|uniref:non-ribosomal peptide synthetase n=1 Tax=Streptomyces sp. NRRL WC-3742 TaxID=1463934 RepID=UPI0007C558D8|nr:non-ribosomal peptide synthetase [Streptomyces sp. NRRL WC-3742]
MSALPAPTTAQTVQPVQTVEPVLTAQPVEPAQPAQPAQPVLTVPELIARHAERTPDALALLDGTTAVTYRELHESAGRLASVLAARGVGPGHAVGLLCARAARLAVAQLAVWRAGGHVVPLDPAYPRPRLAETVEDAGARLVLGDKALLAETGLPAERTLVLGEHDGDSAWGAAPDAARADGPALVFYTSGSTGRPKGVLVPHSAVTDLVTAPDALALGPRDRVLCHSALGFDATTFELWAPLAHGAAVAVASADRPTAEDLVRDVERYGVTTLFLTTALFHHLAARQSRVFGVLRTLAVGGEALSPEYAGAVLRAFPWLELYNVYGPTEATTFTTLHRITAADCTGETPVPIGRPFGGARALVLDERQEPVAPGENGELWIAGARVAQGYLNRPELTAERFRELPGTGRAYRSGDVVRQRPDGALEFQGRTDDQVKVRGFRIEPGEVEQALLRHPEVAEAAVVVRHPGAPDAALTACVVLAEGHRPSVATLRERLAAQLPAHLVPTAWAVLDELPLNGSGKVDRKALAASTADPVEAGATADLTPIQQVVADAWARALGRPVTDPAADFLTEGGHSLLAMWIVDDLREDLGAELSLADFLGHPTVAAQADLLEQALLAAHGAVPDAGSGAGSDAGSAGEEAAR